MNGRFRSKRRIVVVTGSRAEFGLLRSVINALFEQTDLETFVVAGGAHLLGPAFTIQEVCDMFPVAAEVPMQVFGRNSRAADAHALGRGISGFTEAFEFLKPDVVLVLGDRIEAYAAASAAAISGIRLAHVHGGDRAEGISDESIRHAITKLAHLHFPATKTSALRLRRMGEHEQRIHLVGSPSIDDLDSFPPISGQDWSSMGAPRIAFLLHPTGHSIDRERRNAETLLNACIDRGPTIAFAPNSETGAEGILDAITISGVSMVQHLSRNRFVGLLRRVDVLTGNSSCGLIECAHLGVWCVNVGQRQSGREMPANVIDVPDWQQGAIGTSLDRMLISETAPNNHPYGDGCAGHRIGQILATFDPDLYPTWKKNSY